jgi:aryl-alcohol dehydrogenase-like predicted oxidoreductase/spore coat polysaccharide biosynthesis protein SpsF (cytidylyltransferase family)
MRTRVVIQARLSSSRLPGKALLSLAGRPVVVLAAQRAARGGLDVVVATSEDSTDDPVAAELDRVGLACFRGSLEDPLSRFVAVTADLVDDDVVVRLTADNVIPDAALLDELLAALPRDGYVRTASWLPYGLSAEVFRVGLLREADRSASPGPDREHVTPLIRRRTADQQFVPARLAERQGDAAARVRCTIDTLDDYAVAHRAMAPVTDPVGSPWHDLLPRWAEAGGALPAPIDSPRDRSAFQGPWVLGTAQLGQPYGAANTSGMPTRGAAEELLRVAAACGVTHLDTARAYGESEARIGRSLAMGLSERVGVVTKIRPLEGSAAGTAALTAEVSLERSLRTLGVSAVDVLLVHRWSDWTSDDGSVAALMDSLRSAGVARLVGASVARPDELLAALEDPRVGYVQLPFNLLDRRWLTADVQGAVAARPEVVVTARSVFLQGLLAAPERARWPQGVPDDLPALRQGVARAVAALRRESVGDLALAYVRGHEFVTSVVLGADTVEQVREHARLLHRPPLSPEEIEQVHREVSAGSLDLVDPSRWRTP